MSVSNITLNWDKILLQSGVGCVGGYLINTIHQYLHPGKIILGVPPIVLINPLQAAICTLTYALVDRAAAQIFKQSHKDPAADIFRMVGTISFAGIVSSVCLGISFNVAGATILTSIIGTTLLLGATKAYHELCAYIPKEYML